MKRRDFLVAFGGAAAWPAVARAQQGERVRRIGFLFPGIEGDPAGQTRVAAFRDGLTKLGWTETNLRMEVRWGSNPALIERYAIGVIDVPAAMRLRGYKFARHSKVARDGADVLFRVQWYYWFAEPV